MLPWQQLVSDTPQNLISSRSFGAKDVLKIWCKSLQGLGLWNTHKVETQKCEKVSPWEQLLMDPPQNLISSGSLSGKDVIKFVVNCSVGFALRYRRHRCPDGTGYEYNPSLRGWG